MRWVLSLLLVLLVWTMQYVLELPAWQAVAASGAIVVVASAWTLFERLAQARAARALDRAIAQQGTDQALNARPDRRAEIQALQQQVQAGIQALQRSRLGGKRGRGAQALYSLPWYVIVGPPGAGKTTALKHSGLVFPYGDGGIRGVGGTRNCDWWFTNEGILLDTAGRWTTDNQDREEWLSFLRLLRKHRRRQPLNGVLVAISVADLIDASEGQLDLIGRTLRARIDEIGAELQTELPVYVLFTKIDLVAGFAEFFADLKRSDRALPLGATIKLDVDRAQPSRLFDAEFGTLVTQIHARALKRIAQERSREARIKVFQFPLEFAALQRNLAELIGTVFAPAPTGTSPLLRGFYFTSGTQEGKPLERVLSRMGQAMGIGPLESGAFRVPAGLDTESKSYFLHDVFMNVVFPDAAVGGRTKGELRRQRLLRLTVAAVALGLGAAFGIPAWFSYQENQEMLRRSQVLATAAATITWNDPKSSVEKLATMQPLLDELLELERHQREGVPLRLRFFMYQGQVLYPVLARIYAVKMREGFDGPVRARLEARLRGAAGQERYPRERADLRAYLMLSDAAHLDVPWATGRLVTTWTEILKPAAPTLSELDLRRRGLDHVKYYLDLVKRQRIPPLGPPDAEAVAIAQRALLSAPVRRRYYHAFVGSVAEERIDDFGDELSENAKYPPLSLADLFADRPDVLRVLSSAQYEKEKRFYAVEGPYTNEGHYAVFENLAEGPAWLAREAWVVPLTDEERGERVAPYLRQVAEDYDTAYIEAWSRLFTDAKVTSPETVKGAIDEYSSLARPDWPYLRILRTLEDHTQWRWAKPAPPASGADAGKPPKAPAGDYVFQPRTGGPAVTVSPWQAAGRASVVPAFFRRTVDFGVPGPGQPGQLVDTPLAQWVGMVEALRSEMLKGQDPNQSLDVKALRDRLAETTIRSVALLAPFDDPAKTFLTPLLTNPLRIVGTPELAPAGTRPEPGGQQPPPSIKYPWQR